MSYHLYHTIYSNILFNITINNYNILKKTLAIKLTKKTFLVDTEYFVTEIKKKRKEMKERKREREREREIFKL